MNNVIALKESRKGRRARLAAWAAVVAAAAVVIGAPAPGRAGALKAPRLEAGILEIAGTSASENFALRLREGEPGILQVVDGPTVFEFTRADITRIELDARSGDDIVRIDETNGVFTNTVPTTIDGAAGDDTLVGGSGAETFRGGPGDDSIDGNRGADIAFMGSGEDTFIWDPGDGSDVVEGQPGNDTMLFNGANVAETVELSADGHRLRFFRDPAAITMNTDSVERVIFKAFGGADVVTVDDLSGTDVDDVAIDLAVAGGGADNAVDSITVKGTNHNDRIAVAGNALAVTVSGLAATVELLRPEAAKDELRIETFDGKDTVDSAGLAAGVIALFVDGILVP